MATDFMSDLDEMSNATQNDSTTTMQAQVHQGPPKGSEDEWETEIRNDAD